MPSFNAHYFGTKFMGLNYALILSAWGFAGLIGPSIVARAKDLTGSFTGLLPIIASVLLICVILPFLTKKPSPTAGASIGSGDHASVDSTHPGTGLIFKTSPAAVQEAPSSQRHRADGGPYILALCPISFQISVFISGRN